MAENSEKIRVLWIDDCEAADAKEYMWPEAEMPLEYRDLFCIVRHPDIPGPSSIRTPRDFWPLFEGFWNRDETDLFPVEIVAMDYNLRKWQDSSAMVQGETASDDDGMPSDDPSDVSAIVDDVHGVAEQRREGFEGLVTGVFATAMLSDHPTGVVPMTNYGDLLIGHPEVAAIHNLSTPLLNVDYSNFHVSGEGRSWENVLRKGAESLRARIELLFLAGDISLSFDDLMTLSEGKGDRLTVRSKHCVRRLPVQGLFLDATTKWRDAARKWSIERIKAIVTKDRLESLRGARQISETLWDGYNDDDKFYQRRRLSELHDRRDALVDKEKGELQGLYDEIFEVANPDSAKASCTRNVCDLRTFKADGPTVRWTCLLALLKLLARYLRCTKNWKQVNEEGFPALELSSIVAEDWMVTLFPIAQTPLVLPFQNGPCKDYLATGWGKWLRDNLKDNLAMNPKQVLSGMGWGEPIEGKKGKDTMSQGLRESERRVLREIAFDEPGLTEEDWRGTSLTRNVLWGRES